MILNISKKIYGRESEVKTLLDLYHAIEQNGIPALVMVSGYLGIGKTTLVNEFHNQITNSSEGFFIVGKCYPLKNEVPYSSFLESFQVLIKELLSEPEEKLNITRRNLIEALGINGQVIVDIVPQLELIIGKQPQVEELPPAESQVRLMMVFNKFIDVFSKEGILTIFLDDLQWVDVASLKLIKQIMTNPDIKNILLIGAYRVDEVDIDHPLTLTIYEIKKTSVLFKEIKVTALDPKQITDFINDSLQNKTEIIKPLADLIFEKTRGNPFFVVQFLNALYQEKILKFDTKYSLWTWEINEIKAKGYTQNIIDLIDRNIKRLAPETQNILNIAACIGNKFDVKMLSVISSEEEDKIIEELQPAFKAGLIMHDDDHIVFFRDSYLQAAYSLFQEKKIAEIHLKIARQLLATTPNDKNNSSVFEIVNQFNRADLNLVNKDEKLEIAALNYTASKKAKMSIAYDSTVKYADAGIRLLDDEDWKDNYEILFNLHLEKAEGEYLNLNFNNAEKLIDFLLGKANTNVNKSAVYIIKVRIHLFKGEIPAAIETALESLKMFNIHLSPHPSKDEVLIEYQKVNKNMGDREIEDLINLPLMTDPEVIATMEILSVLYAPAYFTNPNLFAIHLAQMVNLSLLYGNTEASVLAYGAYGYALINVYNEYETGYRFAKLGVDLAEKGKFVSFKSDATYFLALLTLWHKPINLGIKIFKDTFQFAMETANLPIAGYSMFHILFHMDFQGDKLEDVFHESQNCIDFNRKIKFVVLEISIVSLQRYILTMQGHTYNLSTYNSKGFSEEKLEKQMKESLPVFQCWHYIYKMKSRFILGNFEEALVAALKAKEIISSIFGLLLLIEFYYYYSLTLTANYEWADADEKNVFLEILNGNVSIIKERAADCPENFQNKYALVQAEIYRITGKNNEAEKYYEEAMKSADENGFIANHAISLELTSRFYRNTGNQNFADRYLKIAQTTYLQWGATGKVKQLQEIYPFLLEQKESNLLAK